MDAIRKYPRLTVGKAYGERITIRKKTTQAKSHGYGQSPRK